ncbi:hypothetical protein PR048_005750 [Dryococelus australis]|uniref:Reverse transcriptase domain-containing protein n=1 Tax=Dryococelus australis TaxID=614101 RepID=A0ABQ9I9M3_9NEOP|nr:hypothetical protein PR048_005750 [Dryococelus australis]
MEFDGQNRCGTPSGSYSLWFGFDPNKDLEVWNRNKHGIRKVEDHSAQFISINFTSISVIPIPMSNITILFQYLSQATYFTLFDLNSVFHHSTRKGRKQRVPFGVNLGKQCLLWILNMLIENFKFQFIDVSFLDNVCVFSNNFEEHLENIHQLLLKLRSAGFLVNCGKVLWA